MMAEQSPAAVERRTDEVVLRKRDLVTADDRYTVRALGPEWEPHLNRIVLCLLARGKRRKLESLDDLRRLTGLSADLVAVNGEAFLEVCERVAERWRLSKAAHRWLSAWGGLASGLRGMAERLPGLEGEERAALDARMDETEAAKFETVTRWYEAQCALADFLGEKRPDDPHAPQPSYVDADNHAGRRIAEVAKRIGANRPKLRDCKVRMIRPIWKLLAERQRAGGLLTYEDIEAALLMSSRAFLERWAVRWNAPATA